MKPEARPAAIPKGAETSDAILKFMESIGRRSEAEFYLALFRAEKKESFANLVIGASVLRDAAEAVVLDLKFLRGLGLVPVVSLGLDSSVPSGTDQAERLCRRLGRAHVPTAAFAAETPGLAEQVAVTARTGALPIVTLTSGGVDASEARFDALGALSAALGTRKLIFVSRRGGLRHRSTGAEISDINLATDYEPLVERRLLEKKGLLLLERSRRLLVERTAHRMFIAVTSPLVLLRELFTVRGAGTLIRRGSRILVKEGLGDVAPARLLGLLESSFGRSLAPGFFEREPARIYLEENYRGAAIVRETPLGAYLCKLAVEREAQGEGLGSDLFRLVAADHKRLFWRARPDNPIAPFYAQSCDGMVHAERWDVYWKGLPYPTIAPAISAAIAQPLDF